MWSSTRIEIVVAGSTSTGAVVAVLTDVGALVDDVVLICGDGDVDPQLAATDALAAQSAARRILRCQFTVTIVPDGSGG